MLGARHLLVVGRSDGRSVSEVCWLLLLLLLFPQVAGLLFE